MAKISTREMVEMYLETGSYEEAGKRLGVSAQTVNKRIKYYATKFFGKDWQRYAIHARMRELLAVLEDSREW